MEHGLFRTELAAIVERYGYLLRRRCQLAIEEPALADRIFRLALHQVARSGSELRGREDKLAWLARVLDEVVSAEAPNTARVDPSNRDLGLEAWHAGDPDPAARARSESTEAKVLLSDLTRARREFAEHIDVSALLDEVFVDEPLPPPASARRRLWTSIAAFVSFFVVAAALWPSQEETGIIPTEFALVALIDRGDEVLRERGPKLELRGGEDLLVELSIPRAQTVSVYVLEDDGDLTPLAVGRLFRPGVHQLPQTLHVDPYKKLSAKLVAGPPALVRTATSTRRFDAVLSIELVSERPSH